MDSIEDSSEDDFRELCIAALRHLIEQQKVTRLSRRFLTKGLPAGFKAPAKFLPDATSVDDGLTALKKAVARLHEDTTRALHPGFGSLTLDEWTQFHLRHAELHMSFLQDAE